MLQRIKTGIATVTHCFELVRETAPLGKQWNEVRETPAAKRWHVKARQKVPGTSGA